MQRIVTLLILGVILTSGLVFGQSNPIVIAEDLATKSPLYYNHTPNIARSSTDNLVVVWNSAEKQVVYSMYDAIFETWTAVVPISNAGERALKAGLAADDNGTIYAVWQQRETSGQDYAIYFSKFDGSNWTTPVNLTGNDIENEEASIAVDDLGNIFVAWNTDGEKDTTNFVYCIQSADGGDTWSEPAILSSEDGVIGGTSSTSGRPVLARGKAGKMIATWHEEPDGHPDRECFVNQYDGENWLGETVNVELADTANTMYPTVALDSNDMVYLVYASFRTPTKLLMKKKAWDAQEWPAVADSILYDVGLTKPVIALDSDDNIYIAFRRDNAADTTYGLEEIAYITSTDGGATWTDQVMLSRPDYDAGYVSLAPRIRDAGVDVIWRESSRPLVDDGDSTTVIYGHIPLVITSVGHTPASRIKDFTLKQNYPNPFNPTTEISFTVAKAGNYELAVYNTLGEQVRVLKNDKLNPGQYKITWNARNSQGQPVASGVYFYQLRGEQSTRTMKMLLLQ